MSVTPDDGNLMYFVGHGRNILINSPENSDDTHLVSRDQLKLFIAYSHTLHNKSPRACPPGPLGYDFFMHVFNSEGLHSSASYLDESGTVVSNGALPKLSDIIGEVEEEDISLSSTRMAQVEQMVWHTALSASHQREKMEMRRAGQRKEKNFGRKQTQKVNKKGLGKIRKESDLPTTYPSVGPSTIGTAEEAMAVTD
ncbi:uncharacterized protein HD556DRAFT_1308494 [Suillus plorans]|uniref:Uncharacterized protein n=1 Tax=Suillus plorans TaxID=116603 RepID=A0A9P7DI35_9AGAM|nr:uncharacterized protein HD556DRAFT_1308494 [Suillus plorans]KAG1793638.1 hypothetical protein HD556DRAFT_1308494 [Suillus plorans]